jgi:hypothetical protein
LLQREILTKLCLELRLRHALRGKRRLVASQRKLTVFLQGRDLADDFPQQIVAGTKPSLSPPREATGADPPAS